MKVPVVTVDRIDIAELYALRTALRRACFSTIELSKTLVVITGQVDTVRLIAQRTCSHGMPRVRKTTVDGEEIKGANEEPGQYRDFTKQKVAVVNGLDRNTRRRMKRFLEEASFYCETDKDMGLLVEYIPARAKELHLLMGAFNGGSFELRSLN